MEMDGLYVVDGGGVRQSFPFHVLQATGGKTETFTWDEKLSFPFILSLERTRRFCKRSNLCVTLPHSH